jgi:hypothetical protein
MEAAARMGQSVLTERIIYPVSFSTLNPQSGVMSTSFAKKISKKANNFPGAHFPVVSTTMAAFRVTSKRCDRSLPPGCRKRAQRSIGAERAN